MGCLVHQQPAGVALVAMPAAEVVGPVAQVEQPLEVHREHLADGVGQEQLAHLGGVRRVAIVEGDPQLASGAVNRIQDLLALLRIDRHRLLGDGVAAQLHGAHDVAVMGTVDRGHDHRVGPGLRDHAVELLRRIGGDRGAARRAVQLVGQVEPGLVHVAERHHLGALGEVAGNRLVEEPRAAAHPHLGIAPTLRCSTHETRTITRIALRRECLKGESSLLRELKHRLGQPLLRRGRKAARCNGSRERLGAARENAVSCIKNRGDAARA